MFFVLLRGNTKSFKSIIAPILAIFGHVTCSANFKVVTIVFILGLLIWFYLINCYIKIGFF